MMEGGVVECHTIVRGPQELGTRTHDVSGEVCDMNVPVRGSTEGTRPRAHQEPSGTRSVAGR
jgi:hypothetical protein